MGQPCFVFLSANHLKTDNNRGDFYRGILSVNKGIEKMYFFHGKKTLKGGEGVSPNPEFPFQKKISFLLDFSLPKWGGGSHPEA